MKSSPPFGTIVFVVIIGLGFLYYRSRHPTETATTSPGHIIAYTPLGDSLTVFDDKSKTAVVATSLIDPVTHKGGKKLDGSVSMGDFGTIFYESPSGRIEFEPNH